jgi:hypothetical protein
VAGTCEYGNEPSGSMKCGEFLGYLLRLVGFSRGTVLHGVSKLHWKALWRRQREIFVFATAFGTGFAAHLTSFPFEPRGSFSVYKVDHFHPVPKYGTCGVFQTWCRQASTACCLGIGKLPLPSLHNLPCKDEDEPEKYLKTQFVPRSKHTASVS